jgi:16S rRNA (guanine966-N2)-methyltransferase
VDASAQVTRTLRDNCQLLSCNTLTLVTADAIKWLQQQNGREEFDIIFLDPPYTLELLPACLHLLASGNFAAQDCVIYMESGQPLEQCPLPESWKLTRSKKAGQVFYGVCERLLN